MNTRMSQKMTGRPFRTTSRGLSGVFSPILQAFDLSGALLSSVSLVWSVILIYR